MQVFLTYSHLAIVMEFAAGGELFDRIVKAGRFSEDEARFFFQQLISGVEYCHSEARTELYSWLYLMNLHQPFLEYNPIVVAKCPWFCYAA